MAAEIDEQSPERLRYWIQKFERDAASYSALAMASSGAAHMHYLLEARNARQKAKELKAKLDRYL